MSFRTGTFEREKTGILRPFCPAHAVGSLPEISLDWLKSEGKKLIMLDVDHTLVEWKQENFSEPVLQWLKRAKEMGFQLCILSNTRRIERLARISETLGIKTYRGKFKPSSDMYEMALSDYKVSPDEAVMIGDQIMTDVLGANRTGIDAIWVQKMHGPEFSGTKINRVIEKIVTSILYRSLVTDTDQSEEPESSVPLLERKIVRQFIKFLFVGAISFAIDFTIRHLLLFVIKSDDLTFGMKMGETVQKSLPGLLQNAKTDSIAFFICAVIASFIATFNSFLLNRAFTFRIKDRKNAGKQAAKVYMVAYVGLAINSTVGTFFFHILPGHPKISSFLATAIGAACAAIWNFFGQRNFAFKAK
jgi:uncharacterized protein